MEITLEAIISFIGLFVGGGAGAFFTWRYQKKKAKAEAEMLAEKSRTEREFFANINEQNKLLKEIKELLKQVESK